MIKTSKNKTQPRTVVHDGKVYRGVMPNMNMKTDLTESFEYIATVVEGMSSGNMNDNPVYDDFKKVIIENTISGEVGKLVNERGHVPKNYTDEHAGRYSSQVAIARGPSQPDPAPEVCPAPKLPAAVGTATSRLVDKMVEKSIKKIEEENISSIDVGIRRVGEKYSMTMLELMKLFDEWEKDHPFAKKNETASARLNRIEKELKAIGKKAVTRAEEEASKVISERQKKLAKRIITSTTETSKKTIAKKRPKIKVAKKTTKKVMKKKVAKKRSTKKVKVIAR